MTKKDYEMIARILREHVETAHNAGELNKARAIARDFTRELAQGNPRFDRRRFLEACGVETSSVEIVR
jgi:hypothetical protein